MCFSKGKYCRDDICKCSGCNNTIEYEKDVKDARKNTLSRNSQAFTSKLEVVITGVEDF